MEVLDRKFLLSEGFFSSSLEEVQYRVVLDQFKKMVVSLKKIVSEKKTLKKIVLYNEKTYYPMMLLISNKDFRITMQQFLSEPFTLFDLERSTGMPQRVIVDEINSIFDELNYQFKDIGFTIIYWKNQGTYRFFAYMDSKKCLKNIINVKKPKLQIPAKDLVKEMNALKEDVMLEIKKHTLGKTIKFDRGYTPQVFRYMPASGSGMCLSLQDEANGYIDKDFEYISPTLSGQDVFLNLAYHLEETKLKDTNVYLCPFVNSNKSKSLYLASRTNIKATF